MEVIVGECRELDTDTAELRRICKRMALRQRMDAGNVDVSTVLHSKSLGLMFMSQIEEFERTLDTWIGIDDKSCVARDAISTLHLCQRRCCDVVRWCDRVLTNDRQPMAND